MGDITFETWHTHMGDMTHSYAWRDPFKCVAQRIHMCDTTHWYGFHGSFTCEEVVSRMSQIITTEGVVSCIPRISIHYITTEEVVSHFSRLSRSVTRLKELCHYLSSYHDWKSRVTISRRTTTERVVSLSLVVPLLKESCHVSLVCLDRYL